MLFLLGIIFQTIATEREDIKIPHHFSSMLVSKVHKVNYTEYYPAIKGTLIKGSGQEQLCGLGRGRGKDMCL